MALAVVFVRKMVQTEQTAAIVFYFSLTCSVLALQTIPFGWVVPTVWEAALVVSAGLFIIWREHRLGIKRGQALSIVTPQG